jgi:hypothetical protein
MQTCVSVEIDTLILSLGHVFETMKIYSQLCNAGHAHMYTYSTQAYEMTRHGYCHAHVAAPRYSTITAQTLSTTHGLIRVHLLVVPLAPPVPACTLASTHPTHKRARTRT